MIFTVRKYLLSNMAPTERKCSFGDNWKLDYDFQVLGNMRISEICSINCSNSSLQIKLAALEKREDGVKLGRAEAALVQDLGLILAL